MIAHIFAVADFDSISSRFGTSGGPLGTQTEVEERSCECKCSAGANSMRQLHRGPPAGHAPVAWERGLTCPYRPKSTWRSLCMRTEDEERHLLSVTGGSPGSGRTMSHETRTRAAMTTKATTKRVMCSPPASVSRGVLRPVRPSERRLAGSTEAGLLRRRVTQTLKLATNVGELSVDLKAPLIRGSSEEIELLLQQPFQIEQ